MVANFSRLCSVYLLYTLSIFLVPIFFKSDREIAKFFRKEYVLNGYIVIFLYTFMEEYMLILLQFTHVNFDYSINIVGFVLAICLSLHIIFMVALYLKKALVKMNYFNEDNLRKYRAFIHHVSIQVSL